MRRVPCVFLCLVVICVARVGEADTVWLKNGDRITGTVTGIADGKITISTDYAGDVAIAMAQVKGIDTEKPLALEGSDGAIEEGVLKYSEAGQTVVVGGEEDDLAVESLTRAAPTRKALDKAIRKANRVWSGAVDSGAVIRSGETDRYDATLDVVLTRKRPVHTLTLKMNSSYGETDDVINAQRLYGEAKWQYFFGDRPLFAFGVATGEHDRLRRLESRFTAGAGVGYTFIDIPRRKLSGELGLEYAVEEWSNFGIGGHSDAVTAVRDGAFVSFRSLLTRLNGGASSLDLNSLLGGIRSFRNFFYPNVGERRRNEEYPSARIGVSYREKLFGSSTLTDDLLVLPDLDDLGSFRLTNTLAFTTPIRENLSFRASLRSEYDSDPGADDVDELDNILSLGIRYSF